MFCPKCGNSLPDDAAFCGACGTQLASATPVQKPKVQVKKSWIAIGAAVLVVALVVVLCVTLIGGNSAKGVLEKYLDGVTGFDGAAIWENASVRVHGCDTKEECVAEQKEMKTQMESYSSMLGGMKTTYKIYGGNARFAQQPFFLDGELHRGGAGRHRDRGGRVHR